MKDSAENVLLLFPQLKQHIRYWIVPKKGQDCIWYAFTFDYSNHDSSHDRWNVYEVDVLLITISDKRDKLIELMSHYATADMRYHYNLRLNRNPQTAQDFCIFNNKELAGLSAV